MCAKKSVLRLVAMLFLFLFVASFVSAGNLIGHKEFYNFRDVEEKKISEESNACSRQCLIDGGWDPDGGLLPNANSSVYCNIKCSPDPCVRGCQPECSTFACQDSCEYKCKKPKVDACEASCEGYEHATWTFYQEKCYCVCHSGYVPGSGGCVKDDGSGNTGSGKTCQHNGECASGQICENGKCVDEDSGEKCINNSECGEGNLCKNGVCIKQFEPDCKSNEGCEKEEKCVNGKCVLGDLSLILTVSPEEVIVNESRQVKITAKVTGSKYGNVKFEISDPDFFFSLGAIKITKSFGADGTAATTLTIPALSEISRLKHDRFPYKMTVKATCNSAGRTATKSKILTLKSTAPVIKSVTVDPDPIKSYSDHTLTVTVEDPDSTEFTYSVEAVSSTLFDSEGTQGKKIQKKIQSKSLALGLHGQEFGFNEQELEKAMGISDTLSGGAKSAAFTGTKKVALGTAKVLAKTAVSENNILILGWSNKVLRFVPIISTGKTLYSLYGSGKAASQEFIALCGSANWKEAFYRFSDLGVEGVRFCAGAIELAGDTVPVIGKLADITQDFVDMGLAQGQEYLRKKALEERFDASEVVKTYDFVNVTVTDESGFSDTETFTFDSEYRWVN